MQLTIMTGFKPAASTHARAFKLSKPVIQAQCVDNLLVMF